MKPLLSVLLLLAASPAAAQSWGGIAWCGETVAVASATRGAVALVQAPSFQVRHLPVPFAGAQDDRRELVWSPDCERVAVVDPKAITILGASDGARTSMQLPSALPGVFGYEGWNGQPSAAWSPSGRSLTAHLVDGPAPYGGRALVRFRVATGDPTVLPLRSGAVPSSFAMIDDEAVLVASGEPLRLHRLTAQGARPVGRGGLHAVRMAGRPLTVVGTRPQRNGAIRVVRIDPRSGRERTIRAGLYTFHAVSADGSAVILDDHLRHLGTDEPTRLWVFGTGRDRRARRYRIDPDRTQGSPDWTWDDAAERVVGNPDASDTRFGTHRHPHRRPQHTHYVVDDGRGPPPLLFRAGPGDPGPWVEEHAVSPGGRWDLFVTTRLGPEPPQCAADELGTRVHRSLVLVELSSRTRQRAPLDVIASCRRITFDP